MRPKVISIMWYKLRTNKNEELIFHKKKNEKLRK